MPPKAERTRPPIKFLAHLNERTTKDLGDLIDSGLDLIERELIHAKPDPDHQVLTGSLRKAAEEQEARDRDRRHQHHAPEETSTERLAKVLGGETYDVPSVLEPLAELAREHTEEEFLDLLRGQTSPEEGAARAKADQREEEYHATWAHLLNKHGDPTKARADPTWDVTDQIATATAVLADLTKERWDEYRARGRAALRKAAEYHNQDGQTPGPVRLRQLYARATNTGELKATDLRYTTNQAVEVRDPTGRWRAATVLDVNPVRAVVTVRREDGQKRTVTHRADIRNPGEEFPLPDDHAGEPSPGVLEPDRNPRVSSTMDDITSPRFDVTLPANSASWKLEKALEPITAEMNDCPLPVNRATWGRNLDAARTSRDELFAQAVEHAGKPFRPNATRDCAKVLFEDQGLSPRRINEKSGEPSVDAETLQALSAEGSALAGAIMAAREAQSKLSQLEAWEPHAVAGQVQTTWDSLGTPHGRYTAAEPNLQNRIREIRETIEAPPGYHLQSFDLGQTEYVTWASLSGDDVLSKAFTDGQDFHVTMYEELRKAAPDVDLHQPDPRQAGKTVNFALLYLMQPFVLAQRLGIPTGDAETLIKAYGNRALRAVEYRDHVLEQFKQTGRTETKFGRTRELFVPTSRAGRHEANKTAWHHHNAGTAAELLKIKQVKLHRALRRRGWGPGDVRIALNMHDELILLVWDDLKHEVGTLGEAKFREEIPGFLPFKVDHRVGPNWLAISK